MAYTCVRVIFEIGHEASIRAKPTSDGFTHDWELFVRGADNTEIHHFVEKVIFYLHESFQNPKRVIKEPPYAVRESGYAGFALHIDIYLKNKHEPSKIRFNYHLTLQDNGPTISKVKREKHVFKNPSEDFRRKLIRGGGVGVGAESASGSHTNHMAALNSDHSADDHKNLVNNKNKGSPQDGNVSKKSKKENMPKNEVQLSPNDPFSIFGPPIKTSKIPLVSKTSSKQQISDKAPPTQEKQSHSSKSSKHSSSSHKERDKEKDRGGGGGGEKERSGGGAEKEKEKTKDKDKDKDKTSLKKNKEETKKEKIKDDKVRIIKTSSKDKDDGKKNSSSTYHDEKSVKDKSSVIDKLFAAPEKESKAEKKEKEKKHKEEKKSKSKDKHKLTDKKENVEVKESYADRAVDKIFAAKDEPKEEKKLHKTNHNADERDEKTSKEKPNAVAGEPKNLFGNSGNNANATIEPAPPTVNNGDATGRKEEKHKHHKHKKDKSKKDAKRDKEERKEKRETKENKEKPSPQPDPAPVIKSTPKRVDSPKRVKKPLKTLFAEMSDKSDSDLSSLDDEPSMRLAPKEPPPESPPEPRVKEEPAPAVAYVTKHDEQTKENKFESVGKKKKKSAEDRENKKRKRKSKDKEENTSNKMIKYEHPSNDSSAALAKQPNAINDVPAEPEHRPKSMSPASETKFTDEYITKLKELQRKIMTLEDNSGLQQIVQVVAETGQYEITTKTFDFDLCTLDESIVQRLLDFFVP